MKIPIAKPDIGKDEIQAVIETMKSGWVSQGEKVEEFEASFANYCGVKYGVAVSSGTAALHIALAALDIKRGDEVITTPLSCVATTNPIVYLNAKPVFVDVDPTTLNVNPTLNEKKVTEKTRAILPVHLFGHPVDLDPLIEVAEKHGLHVIEDAAHAHGARYKGKKVGYNYKLSDIHAAIGIVQLRKLDTYIKKKKENAAYLNEKLNDFNLKLPSEEDYAFNVYYVYHMLVNKGKQEIVDYLEKEGIETRPLLSFIPAQPPYRHEYDAKEYPIARDAHQRGFYVSNSPQLTRDELNFMASVLRKAVSEC